jgi:hypothetical protein
MQIIISLLALVILPLFVIAAFGEIIQAIIESHLYLIVIALWGGFFLFEEFYYTSKKFLKIKSSIQHNTKECNELNEHIEELRKAYLNLQPIDYGSASYVDESSWNYKRPKLGNLQNTENTYDCSLTVCKNAQTQPFKYICKYFDIKINEETLSDFEAVLNDFSAAEEGKLLLITERDRIIKSINNEIPFLIKWFSKGKLIKKLGFEDINFDDLYFPKFSFRYISPGGNSSMSCDTVFDIDMLNRFINYLSQLIKFKKSIRGQRALMTSTLRTQIKNRDNYTCQNCNLSTREEPNLLLEIDHIIPVSKGGITSEDNLQTLCWKCNRSKGSKILESAYLT